MQEALKDECHGVGKALKVSFKSTTECNGDNRNFQLYDYVHIPILYEEFYEVIYYYFCILLILLISYLLYIFLLSFM